MATQLPNPAIRIEVLARTLMNYSTTVKKWQEERHFSSEVHAIRRDDIQRQTGKSASTSGITEDLIVGTDDEARLYQQSRSFAATWLKSCGQYAELHHELACLLATHLPATYSACGLIRPITLNAERTPHLNDGFDWTAYQNQLEAVERDAIEGPVVVSAPVDLGELISIKDAAKTAYCEPTTVKRAAEKAGQISENGVSKAWFDRWKQQRQADGRSHPTKDEPTKDETPRPELSYECPTCSRRYGIPGNCENDRCEGIKLRFIPRR